MKAVRRSIFCRLAVLLTVVHLSIPSGVLASAVTIVVVPLHDGVSDIVSDDLALSFSRALVSEGTEVVSKEKVETVMNYYRREVSGGEGYADEAEESLIRAKEHYYNFDYAEARAQISRAIGLLEGHPEGISKDGELLRNAYVAGAIIEKSADKSGGMGMAKGYIRKALRLDPHYEMEKKAFSPSFVDLFTKVKTDILAQPLGLIFVDTEPQVAEVFINGVLKGVTPLKVSGLPEGSYKLAVRTNKYRPVERDVVVKAGEDAKIREKLVWSGYEKGADGIHNILTSPDEARRQISEGVRIADILKVPKVVMVDADETADGSGEIAVRMVDREFKAGHNPIVIKYDAYKRRLADNLAHTASLLAAQAKADILKNPQKNLDPDGIGDPVLLGGRQKETWRRPGFWMVMGGVLAAAAGGATAGVMLGGGGGSPSSTGSVNVQFK